MMAFNAQVGELIVFGFFRQELRAGESALERPESILSIAPSSVIGLCAEFYSIPFYDVQFSRKHKSKKTILRYNRRCIAAKGDAINYGLCDVNPVKNGIRCWR